MPCPAFIVNPSSSTGGIAVPFPELKLLKPERTRILWVLIHVAPVASIQIIPLSHKQCTINLVLAGEQPTGANIHNAFDPVSDYSFGDFISILVYSSRSRRVRNI